MGRKANRSETRTPDIGLSGVAVRGFKSIRNETRVEIRPLTILAGANSTGKSSIIQPLLLLKQTLEVPYDPGPLCLDGPNVRFTRAEQFLWAGANGIRDGEFSVELKHDTIFMIRICFKAREGEGVAMEWLRFRETGRIKEVHPMMSHEEVVAVMPRDWRGIEDLRSKAKKMRPASWALVWQRWLFMYADGASGTVLGTPAEVNIFDSDLRRMIHLPALRGNPERSYRKSGSGYGFPGLFQDYAASIVLCWFSLNPTVGVRS